MDIDQKNCGRLIGGHYRVAYYRKEEEWSRQIGLEMDYPAICDHGYSPKICYR